MEDTINNNNSENIQKKDPQLQPPLISSFNYQSFPTSKMRVTTTLLFIAGLVSTALAADTIYFSDENWYVASPLSTALATYHYHTEAN